MKKEKVKLLVLSSMFFGLGLVLPLFTGQIPKIGNMLLPMHIPVLLCGFICGWRYGAVVGFFLPLVRSLIFGMPLFFPNAVGMAFELLTYGLLSGLLYEKSKHTVKSLCISLAVTVICGRLVWAAAQVFMLGLGEDGFSFALFVTKGFVNAFPGLILQFVLIPAITLIYRKFEKSNPSAK